MKKKKTNVPKRSPWLTTDSLYRFLVFFLAFMLMVIVITYDRQTRAWNVSVKVGEPAPKDIFSPFDVTFIDDKKTEEVKRLESGQVLNVFRIDDTINARVVKNIDLFFTDLAVMRREPTPGDPTEIVRNIVSDVNLKELLVTASFDVFKEQVRVTVTDMLNKGLIEFSKKVDLLEEDKRAITLQKGEERSDINVFDLLSLSEARDNSYKIAVAQFPKDRKLRNAFIEITGNMLEANIVFDADATKQQRDKMYDATPAVQVNVKKNENVLRRGSIVTPNQLLLFQEIGKKLAKQKVTIDAVNVSIIVLLFFIVLAGQLSVFEPKVYYDLRSIVLMNAIIVGTVVLDKILLSVFALDPFVVPFALAPLLIAILVRPRVGLFLAGGIAVVAGAMTQYNAMVIMTTLFASMVGVFAMIDVRRRVQFFIVGTLVGMTNFLLLFGYSLLKDMTVRDALAQSGVGLLNGLGIIVLLFPGLFIFEKLFNVTTAISLLELSDLNHPLLKKLILEAPGTYHHSLVVSNLAESACEAIGANALLARVGAYFHDIGKIEKAEYFTENQLSHEKNFHDDLSPRMSYFIITNHVKDGIELAKKYKLRKEITDFIVQHHGTGVVYYFYKKAKDSLKNDEEINLSDFRYPGPKPQSKEIAITLLADSIEAASRALSEPTPSSLQGLVDKMVNDKFLDNQLDECELTVLDLYKIRESFVRNLMAIFHTRVEYPDMTTNGTTTKKMVY